MKILFLLIAPLFVVAKVHYAKLEPYESVVLKASASGLVIKADLALEGTLVQDATLIQIDAKLDKISLKQTQESRGLLRKMLKLNQQIAKTLASNMKRQNTHYTRMNQLSTASRVQKDNAYNGFVGVKTQYLGTKEKIINIEKQISDLGYKVAQLKDSIAKKKLRLKAQYLYKLLVHKGDFVAPGTPLAQVYDAKKAKLVLFLELSEIEGLAEKHVYLDDKKTRYRVGKVWKVADEKFISAYRAEIVMPAPKGTFSKLIKVEIKK